MEALRGDGSGSVRCWNERERLLGTDAPRQVPGITDAVELTAGTLHACVRHRTGAVSCWGVRAYLGDGADRHRRTPNTVPGLAL